MANVTLEQSPKSSDKPHSGFGLLSLLGEGGWFSAPVCPSTGLFLGAHRKMYFIYLLRKAPEALWAVVLGKE